MEKKYRIKLEYWDLWGVNDEDMSIIDMDEIKRLSIEWESPIEELMEQVEEYSPIMDYIHPITVEIAD